MNDYHIRCTERATRVQSFGVANATSEPSAKVPLLFAKLDGIIDQLNAARVGQVRTPVSKEALLEAIFSDFKDIARTARAIALEEPGFPTNEFRFPSDYSENTAATHGDYLLNLLEHDAGQSPDQIAAKEILRSKFIGFELPVDFVADLRADRGALDAANAAKHQDNQKGLQSTAAISALLNDAQDVVAQLDAVMRNRFSRDAAKLHAWKQTSRVERGARHSGVAVP